jgi:23S rRNA pseudoU1915 N3-methylase RlmH
LHYFRKVPISKFLSTVVISTYKKILETEEYILEINKLYWSTTTMQKYFGPQPPDEEGYSSDDSQTPPLPIRTGSAKQSRKREIFSGNSNQGASSKASTKKNKKKSRFFFLRANASTKKNKKKIKKKPKLFYNKIQRAVTETKEEIKRFNDNTENLARESKTQLSKTEEKLEEKLEESAKVVGNAVEAVKAAKDEFREELEEVRTWIFVIAGGFLVLAEFLYGRKNPRMLPLVVGVGLIAPNFKKTVGATIVSWGASLAKWWRGN